MLLTNYRCEKPVSVPKGKPSAYGRRLKILRELAGLTQKELGLRSGVGQDQISRLEDGQRQEAGAEATRNLERGLGCKPGQLYGIAPMPGEPDMLESLQKFFASMGDEITPEEAEDMRTSAVLAPGEDPGVSGWHDFLRYRRAVRTKRGTL